MRTAFPEESVRLLTTAAACSLLHNLFLYYSLNGTWIYTVQLGIDNWIDRRCYLHRRKLALIVQSDRVSVTIASSYFEKVLVCFCFPRPIFSSGYLHLPHVSYFFVFTPFEIFSDVTTSLDKKCLPEERCKWPSRNYCKKVMEIKLEVFIQDEK